VKSFKVAAYITAYEDYRAVEACVTAIKNQSYTVEKIFIVDNSVTEPVLLSNYENVIIDAHPENLGISGGLRLALEWVLEHNYDFLWTFDQDSTPASKCLEVLLEVYSQLSQANYKIGIIAPTPIDLRTNQVVEGAVFERDRFIGCKHDSRVQYYECDAPITSGSLISIAAAQTIFPVQIDLFIDGVDFEYGMRLKQKGFHNLIVTSAIIYHQFGNPTKVRLLGKERLVYNYSALRHYYICRNHTYLDTRYAQGWYRLKSCLWRIKFLTHTIVFIWLYDPKDKLKKTWAGLIGTFHGAIGKLGKTWSNV
jgi:rhamnosyltransferase